MTVRKGPSPFHGGVEYGEMRGRVRLVSEMKERVPHVDDEVRTRA